MGYSPPLGDATDVSCMRFELLILLAHVASTWAMTGLIWFVQVVHYPLFAAVGREAFVAYENAHTRLTTLVVMPLMLVEIATAAWLVFVGRPAGIPLWSVWVGLALVGVAWLSTFALQVPQHNVLSTRWDSAAQGFLVHSNWVRTVAWSARGVLVLAMVYGMIEGMKR